jgi:hypothetical protein
LTCGQLIKFLYFFKKYFFGKKKKKPWVVETTLNGGSSGNTGAYEAVQVEDSGEDFDL